MGQATGAAGLSEGSSVRTTATSPRPRWGHLDQTQAGPAGSKGCAQNGWNVVLERASFGCEAVGTPTLACFSGGLLPSAAEEESAACGESDASVRAGKDAPLGSPRWGRVMTPLLHNPSARRQTR